MDKKSFSIDQFIGDLDKDEEKKTKENDSKPNKKQNKSTFTHFVSIPLISKEITERFRSFGVASNK